MACGFCMKVSRNQAVLAEFKSWAQRPTVITFNYYQFTIKVDSTCLKYNRGLGKFQG